MSIEWAEGEIRKLGDPNLADMLRVARKMLKDNHGIDDIPLPEQTGIQVFPAPETKEPLLVDINRYNEAVATDTLTPEIVNDTWLTFWATKSLESNTDLRLTLPSCDRSEEELRRLAAEGRGVVILPDEIFTKNDPEMLRLMFPNVGTNILSPNINVSQSAYSGGGCFDVEMTINDPNKPLSETLARSTTRLNTSINEHGQRGQRLQTYLVASEFSKLLTGSPFDANGAWTTLPGSRFTSSLLRVRRTTDGILQVTGGHQPNHGFRTERKKVA